MIIRKPYAFLIKNFKKIHIALLILSLYVAFRLIDVNSFVSEFMKLGTYDLFADPVTKHITPFLQLSVILLVIGSCSILFLLMHKKKPWKLYLVPIIEYFVLFFVLSMIKSFFARYSDDIATTDLRLSRDLLVMFIVVQVPAIGIYVMRVFGLDLKKFNFNSDQEFLELSEADREEFEIGLSIDKNTFLRGYRRTIRNINYFYQEHKIICKTVLIILAIFTIFQTYKFFFITHRSYKAGDYYSVDGYTFKVNKSFYTDKDYKGEIISKTSSFVVVDITIKNNSAARKINLENFHIRNGSHDYENTRKTFSKEFQDLGTAYDSESKFQRDEVRDFIMIYKVDKKVKPNRFVLYYQEKNGYLRKIKLKTKNISKIDEIEEKELGDSLEINLAKKSDTISFDYSEMEDIILYTVRECSSGKCAFNEKELNTNGAYKVFNLSFSSEEYQVKDMLDFIDNYGVIKYKDNYGEWEELEVKSAVNKRYYGKSIFIQVDNEIAQSEIVLELTIRNKQYNYKLYTPDKTEEQ